MGRVGRLPSSYAAQIRMLQGLGLVIRKDPRFEHETKGRALMLIQELTVALTMVPVVLPTLQAQKK